MKRNYIEDKSKIDPNKFDGYTLTSTVPATIPNSVETGTTIKVNYTVRKDLSYRVEYYYNGVIDDTLTETINNQTYGAEVSLYTNKLKYGYRYRSDTAPIIIGTGDNVIKVYYETDPYQRKYLTYTIEYYKDGVKEDESFGEVAEVQVL